MRYDGAYFQAQGGAFAVQGQREPRRSIVCAEGAHDARVWSARTGRRPACFPDVTGSSLRRFGLQVERNPALGGRAAAAGGMNPDLDEGAGLPELEPVMVRPQGELRSEEHTP